ncbi:tetratricopeptide repeat protein [Myxococcota bacterium]|nr:tetratricopeptide repeat protein [Myxococcota bacterium]
MTHSSPPLTRRWAELDGAGEGSVLFAPRAERLLAEGDAPGAMRIVEAGLRAFPGHPGGERVLARALLATGGREEAARALRLFRGIAERRPERVASWVDLAEAAGRLGDRTTERAAWDRARALGAPPPRASASPAGPPPAEPALEPSRPEGGADADPFETATMAELLLAQGHRDEALEMLRRLVARDPGDEAPRALLQAAEEAKE